MSSTMPMVGCKFRRCGINHLVGEFDFVYLRRYDTISVLLSKFPFFLGYLFIRSTACLFIDIWGIQGSCFVFVILFLFLFETLACGRNS